MESIIRNTLEVNLVLTREEARWLKGLVQNPICDASEESKEDTTMRFRFFEGLPSFQELNK